MRILKKIDKNFTIVLIITIILFFIPQLFWGKLFVVGGDDSRLYYIFPQQFLDNFVFRISSDNILGTIAGYSPRSFLAPIIFIIYLLKQIPFLNVQQLMYGLNLGLGFLFFYLFLGIWIKNKEDHFIYIKVVASFFYIFSTYLINTLYVNQLLAVYLVFTMPATLYLFFKGVQEQKAAYIVLSVSVYSVFSSTLNTIPWAGALIIILLPPFFMVFWEKKRIFVLYSFIFVIIFILLNLHWIVNIIFNYLNSPAQSLLGYYSSEQFKEGSNQLIIAVSGLFSPLNVVFNTRETNFFKNYTLLTTIKLIFLLVIVLAGILKTSNKNLRKYYLVSLASLLLAFLFFSPSFGNWSVSFFSFLNNNVPFFSMFRNMYDKFSFALAFSYAFAFAVSAAILAEKIKNRKYIVTFLVVVLIIIFVNARSFIFQMHNDTKTFNSISGVFTKEFYDLVQYVKNTEPGSRFAWIPLNYPSYAYMKDAKNKGHFYFGTSPLSILTGKVDYTGYLSFGTGSDPDLGGKIFKAIENKEYSYVGKTFQKFNINYVIDNREKLPNEAMNFLYSGNMLQIQDKNFRNAILGKEIKNFGNTYILYKVNPKYKSNLFYLTNRTNNGYENYRTVKFTQKSNSEYNVILKYIKGKEFLIFQDLYNKGWILSLYNKGDKRTVYDSKRVFPVNNYFANGWIINAGEIKDKFSRDYYQENPDGSINIRLNVSFYPQKLIYAAGAISLSAFILIIVWIIFDAIDMFGRRKK